MCASLPAEQLAGTAKLQQNMKQIWCPKECIAAQSFPPRAPLVGEDHTQRGKVGIAMQALEPPLGGGHSCDCVVTAVGFPTLSETGALFTVHGCDLRGRRGHLRQCVQA